MKFGIGQSVPRTEDPRFLTGRGRYVDDIPMPGVLHGHVFRSPHAHARLLSLDTEAAEAADGVVLVMTAADLAAAGVQPVGSHVMPMAFGGPPPAHWPVRDPLPAIGGKVRHVGDPVAFVVANSRAAAEVAADLIEAEFEELPAVVDVAETTAPGAPKVWDEAENNLCFSIPRGDKAGADAAFTKAAHTVSMRLVNNRVNSNSMEPRVSMARVDPADGRLTYWTSSQNPHGQRAPLAQTFGIPESSIRVVSPDVGGGFGMKNNVFSEDVLVIAAARQLGRPVKWTGNRTDGMVGDTHGRDMVADAELALAADGKILGLRVTGDYAMGAYLGGSAIVPLAIGSMMYVGSYNVPAVYVDARAWFTNTTFTGPYRGAGRPEACFVIERLLDVAAREMQIDPADIRRRNFLGADQMPYQSPLGPVYDTGEFEAVLDKTLDLSDWNGFERRQKKSESDGKLRGRGLAYFIETSAIFNDRMELRFDASGNVMIIAGTHNHGQGHETTYRQMVSQWLSIDAEKIRFVQGDTDQVAYGRGTYASRSMSIGGSALLDASNKVIERAKQVASAMFEASADDIEFADGTFSVAGTDVSAGWTEVLQAAFMPMGPTAMMGPGLEAVGSFTPSGFNFPNGCHVVEVEIDRETGAVSLDRYTSVDDSGVIINPLLYAGQIHGGLAMGIGQALMEDMTYDAESGQLLTGSFMDYAMPRADDMPLLDGMILGHHDVPCATNPLGAKGGGESGTVGALPAVVNAIVDALSPFGVKDIRMPATAQRVWQAMQDGAG